MPPYGFLRAIYGPLLPRFTIESIDWVKGPAPGSSMYGYGYQSCDNWLAKSDYCAFAQVVVRQTNPKVMPVSYRVFLNIHHTHMGSDWSTASCWYERETHSSNHLTFPMVVVFSARDDVLYDVGGSNPDGFPLSVSLYALGRKTAKAKGEFRVFPGADPPHVIKA